MIEGRCVVKDYMKGSVVSNLWFSFHIFYLPCYFLNYFMFLNTHDKFSFRKMKLLYYVINTSLRALHKFDLLENRERKCLTT